jgi:hypothetical protein
MTVSSGGMPTKVPATEEERRTRMLAVLFSLAPGIKKALLRGNLPALIAGSNPTLGSLVPSTPPPHHSSANVGAEKPYIYMLQLVGNRRNNLTMKKMREAMDYARAYAHNVTTNATGVPMRLIQNRNYRATPQDLAKVMEVDRAKTASNGSLFEHALDRRALSEALRDGKTGVPCLYIDSDNQLRGIRHIIRTMDMRLNALEQDGWLANSPNPLPSTIASCGWTVDAAKRRYNYEHHAKINGKIRIFDAISHAMGYNGLSWHCLFMVWNEQAVAMAEHIGHVLGGTYVVQGGMNGDAAGISITTKDRVSRACWKDEERKLLNTSHWTQSRDATDTRNTTSLASVDSFPQYLKMKQEADDATEKEENLQKCVL